MASTQDQFRFQKYRRRPQREVSSYDSAWVVFRRLALEVRPHWKLLFLCIGLTISQSLFGFLPPLILGDIVNKLQRGENIDTLLYFEYVVGFATIAGFLSYATGYASMRLAWKFLMDLRAKVYAHMQSLPVAYFDKNQPGKLVSNVMNDPGTVQNLIVGNLTTLASDAVQFILVMVILFRVSWILALLSIVAAPIFIINLLRNMKPLNETSDEIRRTRDEMYGEMHEKLTGIQVVKGFGKERWEIRSFHNLTRGLMGLNIDQSRISSRMWTFAEALGGVGQALILYFGGMMCLRHELLPGTLVTVLLYSVGYVYGPIVRFLLILDPLARTQAAVHRIFRTLDTQNTVSDKTDAVPMPEIDGHVEFKAVEFEYIVDTPVIRGVDLDVQPGELVAFVGFSGSGKTTLANLLMRHFDPQKGSILVDGHDLRDMELRSYRKQIGYVIQEAAVFNTTVLENIRYGKPEASREEVEEAAVAANLHETITKLPDGYDQKMGEKGITLSQGEKQRLSIARALLADPKILILDEATSSLDSQTEAMVQQALDKLLKGRTSFVIAHRLSTIINADKIVVLEDGKITRMGRHDELLTYPDELYARMFRQQFAAALTN